MNTEDNVATIGIDIYCPTPDSRADHCVGRILGENHYSLAESGDRPTERLPGVFASITGR